MTETGRETDHHRQGTQAKQSKTACRPKTNNPVKQAFHWFEQEVQNITGVPANHQPRQTAQAFRTALQEMSSQVGIIQPNALTRRAAEIWRRNNQAS